MNNSQYDYNQNPIEVIRRLNSIEERWKKYPSPRDFQEKAWEFNRNVFYVKREIEETGDDQLSEISEDENNEYTEKMKPIYYLGYEFAAGGLEPGQVEKFLDSVVIQDSFNEEPYIKLGIKFGKFSNQYAGNLRTKFRNAISQASINYLLQGVKDYIELYNKQNLQTSDQPNLGKFDLSNTSELEKGLLSLVFLGGLRLEMKKGESAYLRLRLEQIENKWQDIRIPRGTVEKSWVLIEPLSMAFHDLWEEGGFLGDEQEWESLSQHNIQILSPCMQRCYYLGYELAAGDIRRNKVDELLSTAVRPIEDLSSLSKVP